MSESKALAPIEVFRDNLNRMSPEFAKVLPPHITPDRFVRTAMNAIQQNPSLLELDRGSLFGAVMRAASDGLLADGKQGAIIPFKGKAQWMPMVYGILMKVRNSGELASIAAQLVYKNDKFKYWVDSDGEHIEHEPELFSDRGELIGTYALAKTKDGAVYIEVITEKQMQDIKNASRSKDSGPWNSVFADEMRKKSAIRRLAKRLPMSTDVEAIIQAEDSDYELAKPVTNEPRPERKSRLDALVEDDV
jgi:recombination protein RecT